MPFITREDGEHFVVPSQRDVITVKSKSQLKKELETLSENYGEYVTLQKKNATQYEAAFSPDPGYLLGESIWHHFNRPQDMIYCEAIPDSSEVILVIVKSGSVYLDGSFPVDSVVEELVVFLTQQNNFEIYVYGNVPISKEPEEGKFSFEESSVKQFTILDEPVFPTLALLKIYQLQLLSAVLEAHGIGVFPVKSIMIIALLVVLGYVGYSMITEEDVKKVTVVVKPVKRVNPYQYYNDTLASPAPDQVVAAFMKVMQLVSTIPGWKPNAIEYAGKLAIAKVTTRAADVKGLLDWAKAKDAKVEIKSTGILVEKALTLPNRSQPGQTIAFNDTMASVIDRVKNIRPGNNFNVQQVKMNGKTKSATVTINLQKVSPMVISLIGKQLHGLPVKVVKISAKPTGSFIDSSIVIQVVGS